MIVIAKDAEAKFLEEMQRQKQDLSQIRCLYLQLSQIDIEPKKLFNVFLEELEQVPESYMAEVYICEDRDVFILMHAFMEQAFSDAIDRMLRTLKIEPDKAMTSNFALDEHHALLEGLCHDKSKKISVAEEEKIQAEKKVVISEIMKDLDMNEIETLARRRNDRREPVVLVVDDDQLSRTLVANTVRHKYTTASAVDGRDGLNTYLEQAPDVVFLDIGMPDMNGHDVLECLFQIDPDAYVIMFSGRKDKENIMRALRTGAQGFVGKPFTREKLFEYIGKSHFIHQKAQKITTHRQQVEA